MNITLKMSHTLDIILRIGRTGRVRRSFISWVQYMKVCLKTDSLKDWASSITKQEITIKGISRKASDMARALSSLQMVMNILEIGSEGIRLVKESSNLSIKLLKEAQNSSLFTQGNF